MPSSLQRKLTYLTLFNGNHSSEKNMNEWIDVHSSLPPHNTVVIGMANTIEFAERTIPRMVGLDPSRGWITWPEQELCFVFHWQMITTPCGKTIKIFEETKEEITGGDKHDTTIFDYPGTPE
jgi:hypothetical protein